MSVCLGSQESKINSMRLNVGTKVVYRQKILATVEERLCDKQNIYRIRLRDHASEQNPYYNGTVCTIDEIVPCER